MLSMDPYAPGWPPVDERCPDFYTRVERGVRNRTLIAAVAAAMRSPLSWRHHASVGVLQAYLPLTDPEVRVHIWHNDLIVPDMLRSGSVHDHRFFLSSTVLMGRIGSEEYSLREDPSGQVGSMEMYSVLHARAGSERPTKLGGTFDAETNVSIIPAGSSYAIPAGIFHRSRLDSDGYAVTVVTKYNQQERPARILVPRESVPQHAFASPTMSVMDIAEHVVAATDALIHSI